MAGFRREEGDGAGHEGTEAEKLGVFSGFAKPHEGVRGRVWGEASRQGEERTGGCRGDLGVIGLWGQSQEGPRWTLS